MILRSREQEIEEGEKCTRYFLKKVVSRWGGIQKLKREGREESRIEGILEMTEHFYGDLYAAKPVHNETMEEVLQFLSSTTNSQSVLTEDFTLAETFKCLKGFKTGKCPGEDGLPVERPFMTF